MTYICPKCKSDKIYRKLVLTDFETVCDDCGFYEDTRFFIPKKFLTPEEVYKKLFFEERVRILETMEVDKFYPVDKLNRMCNIYAVKNAPSVWRKQWKS